MQEIRNPARALDTPRKRVLFLRLLEQYPVKKVAAAKAGIPEHTLYDWINDDAEFETLVELAVNRGRAAMMEQISIAAPDDWRAAAWILERTDPAGFGPVSKVQQQHTGPAGGPIQADVVVSIPLQQRLTDVLSALAEAGRLPAGFDPSLIIEGVAVDTGGGTGTETE